MASARDQNWQDNQSDVQEALCYAYKHSLFNDVTIHTSSDGKSSMCFSAHKTVLAIKSPEFADMLFGKSRKSNIISMNISPRALDIILWYIYSNTIEVEGLDELLESCRAARLFKIIGFSEACCLKLLHLSSNLQESNVLFVMEEASILNSIELFLKCVQFIENVLERILSSNDFYLLSKDTFWKMLKALNLSKCPKSTLKFVIKWMQKNNTKDRVLLSVFDFADFSADDFLEVVEEFKDFFSKDEIYSITSNLLQPGLSKLPPWCKFSKAIESCIKLLQPLPLEGVEIIKEKAIKMETNCSQSFNKFSFLSLRGFQQDLLLKLCNPCHSLRLVMIELAFGTDYVPIENFKIELCSNIGPRGKMQSISFYLISSREHYYLVPSGDNTLPSEKNSFNLLMKIQAKELLTWGHGRPVSNLKYRTALVSSIKTINLNVTGNRQIVPPISLKPFAKWLLFVDPELGEKKFVISALYFDTLENIQNYLVYVEKDKRLKRS